MENLVWFNNDNFMKAKVVTDSLVIANNTNNEHDSIKALIRNYRDEFCELGEPLDFKSSGKNGTKGYKTWYELTEAQATFLITLLRNNKIVVEFKMNLVKQFYKMRNELTQIKTARREGITCRHSLTDSIKDNVAGYNKYAYVTNISYKILFGKTAKQLRDFYNVKTNDGLRDYLPKEKLYLVGKIEDDIASLLYYIPLSEVIEMVTKRYK